VSDPGFQQPGEKQCGKILRYLSNTAESWVFLRFAQHEVRILKDRKKVILLFPSATKRFQQPQQNRRGGQPRQSVPRMKERIDKLLVQRGLVNSRERAQALVLAGRVLVNGQKVEKAGAQVESEAELRLLGEDLRYVSRGGLKLEAALESWKIDLNGRTCMDVGASTGGFTDCMLQHGAAEVIAVDTGYGQIAARLRGDSRVKLLEKTNARYLTAEQVRGTGTTGPVSFIAMDVSFISVTLILPAVLQAAFSPLSSPREMVVLIKPQFEAGREHVGKGGIVRDEQAQQQAVKKVRRAIEELGGSNIEVMDSPILGAEGNREFLLHAEF
jgi:23S rRNA (cytidine1920-2'-O)/16S rRNA (cytidine1409-2'-O)-methyltransferase